MSQILDRKHATQLVRDWQSNGQKVVFTNGCFDILHLGHVTYLEAAAKLGERLVVGVNDDVSVRRLEKGSERPVNPEQARAALIAALRCVDAVVVFSEPTPFELIEALKPDVLVKGGDYDPAEKDPASPSYIVGSAETLARGGKVQTIPLVKGYSTTAIIRKLNA